jgi:tetratricopeptide (TPR) repeat protein
VLLFFLLITQSDAIARGEALLWDAGDDVASYTAALAAFDEAPADARVHGLRAEAYLRLGDLQTNKAQKRSFYEKGRDAAKAGIALDPRCARCHFWLGANVGRWGQVRGVLESLFLLDEVKGAFQAALKADPAYLDAKLSLGKIDEAVPGFAGGSVERAEKAFREVIEKDPHFTRAMLDLAELLVREGKKDEGRAWTLRVLKEKMPSYPGEHRKFDVARAKRLLNESAQ